MVNFSKIKLLATDVDGVLTDACMYYFEDGNEAKKFNFRDGMAISLIKERRIKVVFITQENTNIVKRRAEKLGVELYQNIKDKWGLLDNIRRDLNLQWENIAFVGDDINDLQALMTSGVAICPNDAVDDVKEQCNVVTNAKGGEGVIREIYERYIRQPDVNHPRINSEAHPVRDMGNRLIRRH